jgi:uncharacterized protein (UPF0276 family)
VCVCVSQLQMGNFYNYKTRVRDAECVCLHDYKNIKNDGHNYGLLGHKYLARVVQWYIPK